MSDLNDAIKRIHQELDQVHRVKKCASCECLLDALEALQGDLGRIDSAESRAAQVDMRRWLEEGNKKRHRCLGCEVCLPIAPYNDFSALLRSEQSIGAEAPTEEIETSSPCGCGDTCGTKPVQPDSVQKWPVVEGDYLVGEPSSSVAICTLADRDLLAEVQAAGLLGRVTIVGPLSTENLGVERVIRNVVANPNIGYLILCGRDSRGHRAGQALLSFKASGVDENHRIVGAVGPRPILKNIADEELEAFRQRVAVVDEIGTRDVPRLVDIVQTYLARPKEAPPILPPKIQMPKMIEAQRVSNREWVHDSEGFFVILLDRDAQAIVCEHYTTDGTLDEVIRGVRAEDVAKLAIKRGLLSRLDHAAYLGRELAKAEASLALGLLYVQDEPLEDAQAALSQKAAS
ncbi:MAG: DUF4346 domain-containing protein [Chloroflexi bacterium]|nr:DUF4346 domain-containing protein [Chloroflexota bacterium]